MAEDKWIINKNKYEDLGYSPHADLELHTLHSITFQFCTGKPRDEEMFFCTWISKKSEVRAGVGTHARLDTLLVKPVDRL